MAIVPKAVYKFNVFSNKIPRQFFTEIEKQIFNFMWKQKQAGQPK